jgi:hypothetical protein
MVILETKFSFFNVFNNKNEKILIMNENYPQFEVSPLYN